MLTVGDPETQGGDGVDKFVGKVDTASCLDHDSHAAQKIAHRIQDQ